MKGRCKCAESQAAEAKRLLDRERKALQEARQAVPGDAATTDHAQTSTQHSVQFSQVLSPTMESSYLFMHVKQVSQTLVWLAIKSRSKGSTFDGAVTRHAS